MSTSKIEWTDKTWNPVTGCTKVSQGCKHCYAETFYERFNGKGSFRNITCHPDRLLVPMRWKKPAMVFVNSMSDLFHESVPFEFIDQVFAIMSLCPQHTFQVLTKRAERMLEYFTQDRTEQRDKIVFDIDGLYPVHFENEAQFPNVWLGVSAEDQKTATERIPLLLQVPAAIRFVSCEPLLGPITFTPNFPVDAEGVEKEFHNFLSGVKTIPSRGSYPATCSSGAKIDWVIVGGESGHGARPMHPDWVRSIRNQCDAEATAFFFKQWGQWSFHHMNHSPKWLRDNSFESSDEVNGWHTFDDGTTMKRIGKHKSGKLLDGKEYQAFPLTHSL